MRIEKCGGSKQHPWGYVLEDVFNVKGRPSARTTASGREEWQVPRPRKVRSFPAPTNIKGAQFADESISGRPREVRYRASVVEQKRGSELHSIRLPAWCHCWGCGYRGWVKPEDVETDQEA